jgi:hypothetical protein
MAYENVKHDQLSLIQGYCLPMNFKIEKKLKYGKRKKIWFLFWVDPNLHLDNKLLVPKFKEKCWHIG